MRRVRIAVVGSPYVGKTTLINHLTPLPPKPEASGIDGVVLNHVVLRKIPMAICECEGWTPSTKQWVGCSRFAVVFSVLDASSFKDALSYVNMIKKKSNNPRIVIVANKCDEDEDRWAIDLSRVRLLCDEAGVKVIYTSLITDRSTKIIEYLIRGVEPPDEDGSWAA